MNRLEKIQISAKDSIQVGLEQKINFFKTFLTPEQIITDEKKLAVHNMDTQQIFKGFSKLMLYPTSTEQVQQIMKFCHQHNIKVVLQSGHSSLVGGGTPVNDELIVNFSKFNKILKYDEKTSVITLEPGCILGKVQKYLSKHDAELPFDIMSRERCQIGGNIATHAGGIHFVKHGPMRAYILGLEVVLADGQILNMQSEIRKDNTLQDLKQLFIGSEGTLGIVTKAQILTTRTEKFKKVYFAKVPKYENMIDILKYATRSFGNNLSAFEYFDFASYHTTHKMLGKMIEFPFSVHQETQSGSFYALIETTSREDISHIQQEFAEILDHKDLVETGSFNKTETEFRNWWMIRKMIANAFMGQGIMLAFDLSLNIELFDKLVQDVHKQCGKLVGGFGHIGDSNIHLAILCKDQEDLEQVNKSLDPFMYNYIKEVNGSISAEHGIGRQKQNKMKYAKTELELAYIKKLKHVFDPKNILNSYAFDGQNSSECINHNLSTQIHCWCS